MRELLKKRERENVKFLILMCISIVSFISLPYLIFNLNIIDVQEGIFYLCFILFVFSCSFLSLNYLKEISIEDLKIIIEDKEYEEFKPFLKKMQIHIKKDRLIYDYFYRTLDFYEEHLKEQIDENKNIKRQFLKEIKGIDK